MWRDAEPRDVPYKDHGAKVVTLVSVLTRSHQSPDIVSRLSIPLIHQSRFPHVSLFNITSHLGHLAPVRPDRPPLMAIGHRNRTLTILARNNGSELYVLRRTRMYCLGEEPGKEITRASYPRRPGESTVASKHLTD